MSQKKIELIQQLLAKAESTTPAEAEALTEHAERLMVKYGIEQAMLDSHTGDKGDTIIQDTVDFTGAYRLEWIVLGHNVCMGLGGLRVMKSTYKNKWARLYIIGYSADVARAKMLIESLKTQCQVATRAWWKENKEQYSWMPSYDQEAARRSFAQGFGVGAGTRIKNNRLQVVEEAGTGTELVLVGREQRVQEYYDGLAKTTRKARPSKGNHSARGHGIVAGQNANTGEKAVGATKSIS